MKKIIAVLFAVCFAAACQTTTDRQKTAIKTTDARLDISETGIVPTSHVVEADDGPRIYRESHRIEADNLYMFANLNFVSVNKTGFKLGPGLLAKWEQDLNDVGFRNTGRAKSEDIAIGNMQYATSLLDDEHCFVFVTVYNPIGPFYRGYIAGAYCQEEGRPLAETFVETMDKVQVSLF